MTHGIFIGRFQPFHRGHADVVARNYGKYDRFTIVIGSAQYGYTVDNPMTAAERYEMIRVYLENLGIDADIIPVEDVGVYPLWASKIESIVPKFDVVITGNRLVAELFKQRGYEIQLVHPEFPEHSGTFIRRMIREGDWRALDFVPQRVASYLEDTDIVSRIRRPTQ